MIKFDVFNRWSSKVQFTAEIDCDETLSPRLKLGLAVQWAYKSGADPSGADPSGADLRGADLRGAVLSDADLSDAVLSGADLSGAVLSGADLRGADLRDAVLSGADLRGADLSGADLSGADLSDADLRGAVPSGADLRGADLSDADLSDADLRGADLRGADLRGAALSGAVLSGAVLSDADLSGVPKIENIHQAVYDAASQPGALDMGNWHCGTTHCRAGWVVTLAGDAGRAMEFSMGTAGAAAMIYLASDPKIERIPNFFTTNDKALADMKRLAEQEGNHV